MKAPLNYIQPWVYLALLTVAVVATGVILALG